MKKSVITLALVLVIALLTGCAGTPVVYYSDCTCPTGAHTETQPAPVESTPVETTAPAEADLAASVTISIGGFQSLIASFLQPELNNTEKIADRPVQGETGGQIVQENQHDSRHHHRPCGHCHRKRCLSCVQPCAENRTGTHCPGSTAPDG